MDPRLSGDETVPYEVFRRSQLRQNHDPRRPIKIGLAFGYECSMLIAVVENNDPRNKGDLKNKLRYSKRKHERYCEVVQ